MPLAAFVPLQPPLAVQLVGLFVALQPSVALAPLVMVLGLTDILTTGFDTAGFVGVVGVVGVVGIVGVVGVVPPLLGGVVVVVPSAAMVVFSPLALVFVVTVWPVVGSVTVTTFSPVDGLTVSTTFLPSSVVVTTCAVSVAGLFLLSLFSTDVGTSRPNINTRNIRVPAVIMLIAIIFLNLMTLKTPRCVFYYLVCLVHGVARALLSSWVVGHI